MAMADNGRSPEAVHTTTDQEGPGPVGTDRSRGARDPAVDGDVRARRRHIADERVDLGGGARPQHDGQRSPVGDRARSAGVGRLHPDRQQDRRPLSGASGPTCSGCSATPSAPLAMTLAQGLTADHHLLGRHRRARCVAAAARHAVAHPRQLRGQRAAEGLRHGGRVGRHRHRRRTAARRVHHHLPVLAGRLPARGRRDRGRAVRASGWSRTCRTPDRGRSTLVGAVLSVVGMGGIVLGILVWQEGGESVARAHGRSGALALAALVWWLRAAQARRASRR